LGLVAVGDACIRVAGGCDDTGCDRRQAVALQAATRRPERAHPAPRTPTREANARYSARHNTCPRR
jgi:hypothetical protein